MTLERTQELESAADVVLPDTPVGRVVSAYLDLHSTPADEVSLERWDALYHPDNLAKWPRQPDDVRRERMRKGQARGGGFELEEVESSSPYLMAVTLAYANGKRFKVNIEVDEQAPHQITNEWWRQVHDFDLVVREATEADAAVLADIERRSPVVTEDVSVATDRGEDYFAAARLLEDVTVIVAEVEGEPAGVAWGTVHPTNIAGAERRMYYFFHLRVLPEHQRKGLWGALTGKMWEIYSDRSDHFYGYLNPANVAWKHVSEERGGMPGTWRHSVYRTHLATGELAGPAAGRPATPADAPRITEILNACHGNEEMYFPYTPASLTLRLSRDRSLYSWEHVLVGEGAVVGVWPAGSKIRLITTRDGQTTESRPGYVLDYGFLPGAEAELERLLRAWCGRLTREGMDRLSIFTSEGSPSYPVLAPLATDMERIVLTLNPPIPVPEDLGARGLYVDHVYF